MLVGESPGPLRSGDERGAQRSAVAARMRWHMHLAENSRGGCGGGKERIEEQTAREADPVGLPVSSRRNRRDAPQQFYEALAQASLHRGGDVAFRALGVGCRDRCADGVAKPLIHKDAIGCQRHQIRDALIGVAAGARHGFDQMLVSHGLQAQRFCQLSINPCDRITAERFSDWARRTIGGREPPRRPPTRFVHLAYEHEAIGEPGCVKRVHGMGFMAVDDDGLRPSPIAGATIFVSRRRLQTGLPGFGRETRAARQVREPVARTPERSGRE